ncbi:hypothetical protein C8R47DRAFT_1327306 [Mycena vitilis]|nr:hypothetical protein C8R47DRAFT_1327306 [Mycena vitilis]
MLSVKSLLSFATAANLLSRAAGQSGEVMVYQTSAGGTGSCTGGGMPISGSDFNCRAFGVSNAAGFNILTDNGSPGINLFSDKYV